MAKRRIDTARGMEALRAWREVVERGGEAPRPVVLTAVRFTLTAPLPDAVAAAPRTAPHSRANTTYDLSGRRVSTAAPHGLVIRGGRKMMR